MVIKNQKQTGPNFWMIESAWFNSIPNVYFYGKRYTLFAEYNGKDIPRDPEPTLFGT